MIPPGIPVVLLHAFPLTAEMWAEQVGLLPGRAVLAPEFPGFGGRPPGPASLDEFAEAVAAEMDAAGFARAVVVGLSMGGYVAFRLWERYPDRVAGLVLADTRAGADAEAAREKRTQQAERARAEGVEWLADTLLPALLGETTRQGRPEVVARVRLLIDGADPEGVARALLAMRDRPDSTQLLPRIQVPVLALAGSEDTITPVEEAAAIAEAVPHGQLAVIQGAGHLSNLEDPVEFDRALQSFLG